MERGGPSPIKEFLTVQARILPIVGLSLIESFSPNTRRKIREQQNYQCPVSGEYDPHLSIHHRVPESLGGTDDIENGVGLSREVHDEWDRKTLEEGIVYPGIPIEHVPKKLFRNQKIREKVLYQFRH